MDRMMHVGRKPVNSDKQFGESTEYKGHAESEMRFVVLVAGCHP